jgi:hypothetical protein
MEELNARKSGSFSIGGDVKIHRLGFGAMRITGPMPWHLGAAFGSGRSRPDVEASSRTRN